MGDLVRCVALRAVHADRRYRPGETLELDAADAELLVAEGAVRLADPDWTEGSGGKAPAPGPDAEDERATTLVSGVGPKTADRLAERGILNLSHLAALSDARVAELAEHLDVIGDEVAALTDWRAQARRLVGAGTDA